MPAGWGEEERFAAAIEYGATPGYAGAHDDATEDLARELELVALLQSAGPALSPTPAARSRAKERLAAAFAAQHSSAQNPGGHADDTGPVDVIAPVAVAEPPQESVPTGSGLRPTTAVQRSPMEQAIHSLTPSHYSESDVEKLVQTITDQIMAAAAAS